MKILTHRVIAVVPYVGSGKAGDPRRPKYAPLPAVSGAAATTKANAATTAAPTPTAHSGIIAFTHVPSDDGTMAIVEFVSTDRASLLPILSDQTIVAFEKGVHTPAAILAALAIYKKTFTLNGFGMAAQ